MEVAIVRQSLDNTAPQYAQGYQHEIAKTGFELGSAPDQIVEMGYTKYVGPNGVFAIDNTNGYSTAIPNGDAKNLLDAPHYGSTAEEHNDKALEYFKTAGIPAEQISGVDVSTLMSGSGTTGPEARTATSRYNLQAYYSILRRELNGIPVPDSVAVVRFANSGEVVTETVYWPKIPTSVVSSALAFKASLGKEGGSDSYRAKLPTTVAEGKVVIRHTALSYRGEFEARVSYEAVDMARDTAIVRHFDPTGVEVRLPEERVAD